MTTTPTDDQTIGNPSHLLEAIGDRGLGDVIDLALVATEPAPLEPGHVYAVAVPIGAQVQIIDRDLDKYRDHPRRVEGRYVVRTGASLLAYLSKHGLPETELWADLDALRVTAVIDAHEGHDLPAGWQNHLAVLQLHESTAWQAWNNINGKLLTQVDFAEFIEQRTPDFVNPNGADVLELAQSFQAARSGRFESSRRLNSGETNLVWKEDIQATAGRSGELTIPDVLELALVPFEGAGTAYKVKARLRYRMHDGKLTLGVVLERPEDVLRDAFDQVIDDLATGLVNIPVYAGPWPAPRT